jgi:integrase
MRIYEVLDSMAEVHPFTNIDDVVAVKRILTKWGKIREAEIVYIGCHVGLRIGDLLKIKFSDVESGWLNVTEEKTGKKRTAIPVEDYLLDSVAILKKWYADKYPYMNPVYLFQSTRTKLNDGEVKPIDSSYFRTAFKEATEALALDGNFSTHSLRKTFGYHQYQDTGDITQLQKLFNHSSSLITLAYIGVTRKTQQAMYKKKLF